MFKENNNKENAHRDKQRGKENHGQNQNVNQPSITKEDIKNEEENIFQRFEPTKHSEILHRLLDQIGKIDFREHVGFSDKNEKLAKKHFIVCCIDHIIEVATKNDWGMCCHNSMVYIYNGAYWISLSNEELQSFLGKAAEKMGIDKYDARFYQFNEQLVKQFNSIAKLQKPKQPPEAVYINMRNGTFEISPEKQELRPPKREDFIKYQLPFEYNPNASCSIFDKYLKRVLPDVERQKVLAEYIGYLFIRNSTLKLEKTLLLYGTGANGKSVFFEVINELLGGEDNVCACSLSHLTNDCGYYRATLANKLLNYASEINGKFDTSIFKQLASGEPVDARLPYGNPFTMQNYARLIFNCNELPKDVEQTPAFFRRFLIIPFDVTIPEDEQDKELAQKIINNELSGVLNWVLAGLRRLLKQKKFTYSDAVENECKKYKEQSDTVLLFINEEQYIKSTDDHTEFKDLFSCYREYCGDSGYRPVSKKNFGERLRNAGIEIEKKHIGMVVYLRKQFK